MNRALIKKYKTEFDHWLNGGEVYWYNCNYKEEETDEWLPCEPECSWAIDTHYVIQDKHFEARKAHALGEEIEWITPNTSHGKWEKCDHSCLWDDSFEYRPQPKTKTIIVEKWFVRFADRSYGYTYFDKGFADTSDKDLIKYICDEEIEIEE